MFNFSRLVAHHPARVLLFVASIILPLVSYFLFYPLEIECDIRRGFANKHGRAVAELSRFSNFYNISVGGLEIWGLLVRNKSFDEHLEISPQLLDEVDQLHQFVWNFSTEFKGKPVKLSDLASTDINYVFNYYRKLLEVEWLPGVNLSYPLASAFGNTFYLGSQFFGVNAKLESENGPLKTAKFIALWYMSKAETYPEKQKLQAVQLGIYQQATDNYSTTFNFEMFGDEVANAEMLRGTLTTVKLFVIGGLLMITFMAITFNDLTVFSQTMIIIGAIGSPLASIATCFAILGWIGHPFNSIMCITPFLILGIGVDDAFLLLNCWRHNELKSAGIRNKQDLENRLRRVIYDISPSMAITSLTNTMAFGVGFLSPTPQMSSFCLCTALAIVLDFIFEFLIFVPVLTIFYERKEGEKKKEGPREERFYWKRFTEAILSPVGRVAVILMYIAVMYAAYFGTSTIETTFDPSKTFPSDSKLVDALKSFTYVQEQYSPINFLSKVPNLENATERQRFDEMLMRLEKREGCYGDEKNHNMYKDYIKFLNISNDDDNDTPSYNKFGEFLEKRELADKQTVRWHREGNTTHVDIVNFVVVCRGHKSWANRALALEATRRIIDDYPEFETSLFDYDATIYDLITTVMGELVKSLAITFTCMTLACFVIMPSFVAPTIASIATVSISFCLLGFLSIWGQNLDPVTMIDVIMAIGFSVDYSAHVCFHYYCAVRKGNYTSKRDVLTRVLGSIGRPVIEASLTTLLCMAPLFIVPVYMIRSFAKTVTLVTTFGLLHGLFFLPVLLYFIPLKTQRQSLPVSTTIEPLVQNEDEK